MWTKEYEITTYWDKVIASEYLTSVYFRELKDDLNFFNLRLIPEAVDKVVDVGAGAFGGIFSLLDIGKNKIIVDPIATEFRDKYGKISTDIECIDGYCQALTLADDSIDVLFCIEALDHCNSVEELYQSIREIKRVVKIGGLVFFMMPVRPKEIEGHPLHIGIVKPDDIFRQFSDWNLLQRLFDHNHIFLTAKR
jgi:Methyltransferase domain.